MGNAILTGKGSPLRLSLQLEDSDRSMPKRVKAILKNQDGILLDDSGVELTHIGLGLFKNDIISMPNSTQQVIAQYIVYESNGTTEDEEYSIDIDQFLLSSSVVGGSSAGYLGDVLELELAEGPETEVELASDDQSLVIEIEEV